MIAKLQRSAHSTLHPLKRGIISTSMHLSMHRGKEIVLLHCLCAFYTLFLVQYSIFIKYRSVRIFPPSRSQCVLRWKCAIEEKADKNHWKIKFGTAETVVSRVQVIMGIICIIKMCILSRLLSIHGLLFALCSCLHNSSIIFATDNVLWVQIWFGFFCAWFAFWVLCIQIMARGLFLGCSSHICFLHLSTAKIVWVLRCVFVFSYNFGFSFRFG